MLERFAKFFSIACGIILFFGLAWTFGFSVANTKSFPTHQINRALEITESLLTYGEVVPAKRRMLAPKNAARTPFTTHQPEAAIGSGHYAVMGWNDTAKRYGVWLYSATGEMVHEWPIDLALLGGIKENSPHGMTVLKDGSVAFTIGWSNTMARIDACGTPLWKLDGAYHHSLDLTDDGGLWTWLGARDPHSPLQWIVEVDALTGRERRRIDVAELVRHSQQSATLMSFPSDRTIDFRYSTLKDPFHPNDVEVLREDMAAAFPMFEAGDLLISLKTLDMIAVIAPTGEVKFSRYGPWRVQHDPDFQADGTITVFNNNKDRRASDIVSVDPSTGGIKSLTPRLKAPFYTGFRGKHQILPNGNILLTIPEQGQVLEVVPADQSIAVEINNISAFSSDFNEDTPNGIWLPADFFTKSPECSAGNSRP